MSIFGLFSLQPPVHQLLYPGNIHVRTTQQHSVGLTLWKASVSWLR